MSKAKHTPGPWGTYPSPYPKGVAGAQVSVMPPEFDPTSPKSEWPYSVAMVSLSSPNAEANARLIAAAPDLLDACRIAQKCLIDLAPYPPEVTEGVVGIVGVIRAAIAKAEAP